MNGFDYRMLNVCQPRISHKWELGHDSELYFPRTCAIVLYKYM